MKKQQIEAHWKNQLKNNKKKNNISMVMEYYNTTTATYMKIIGDMILEMVPQLLKLKVDKSIKDYSRMIQKNGYGKMKLPSGNTYKGYWKNN